MTLVAILIGGGIGATLRAFLTELIPPQGRHSFPVSTFIINLIGCFMFGFLTPLFTEHHALYFFIFVGILGGFTTFSTLQLDLIKMIQHRHWQSFILLFVIQYLGCFIAIFIGYQYSFVLFDSLHLQ
ncbi:CrcB family protein [Staphylococcus chromogenes]|uniref:fluoride efflux transporter FluC n=1 Tax=Staphylococcus chromogenes TaxID=46126 RepID=UPI0021CFB521|nr:CrcB family protein [Staphylococcus chromogenes]UXS68750.1 CrcB family protein [Staphylococcus chromogenes]